MLVLKMSEDKTLLITKRGNTYQDESNAELIKIILPKTLNGNNLKDCNVYLSFINQKGIGNVSMLTDGLTEYHDNYYVIEMPIHQIFTYEPGTVSMWVKVLHTPSEMVAKTNEVSYDIKTHREVDGTIPEQEMSIIDGLITKLDSTTTKVNEVNNKVKEINDYVSKLQEGVVLLARPNK